MALATMASCWPVKRGVWEAGGVPLEMPVMSLGETLMRPTTMLFRNQAVLREHDILYPADRFDAARHRSRRGAAQATAGAARTVRSSRRCSRRSLRPIRTIRR